MIWIWPDINSGKNQARFHVPISPQKHSVTGHQSAPPSLAIFFSAVFQPSGLHPRLTGVCSLCLPQWTSTWQTAATTHKHTDAARVCVFVGKKTSHITTTTLTSWCKICLDIVCLLAKTEFIHLNVAWNEITFIVIQTVYTVLSFCR